MSTSKSVGCGQASIAVAGLLFGLMVLGNIASGCERSKLDEAKAQAEARAAVAKEQASKAEAERIIKMKSLPASEHFIFIQSVFDGMKKTNFNLPGCMKMKDRLAFIPKDAPEYAKSMALVNSTETRIESDRKAIEVKREAERKAFRRAQLAEFRKQGVHIGMTAERVRQSSWGRPNSINRSQYGDGVLREQWCYGGLNFLYFENGILTAIQN